MTLPASPPPVAPPAQPGGSAAVSLLSGSLERLALAAGALVMIAIVAASVLIASRTGNDARHAAQAQSVRALTVDLMQAVISAETGQRGYLLTGHVEYLSPFIEARRRIPGLLDLLGAVLSHDPDMARWRAAIQDKMAELQGTVELQQAGHHDAALSIVQSNRGRQDMLIARAIAARLAVTQADAVAADLTHSEAGARLLVAVDAGALVLLVLLVAFVGRSLRRSVLALHRSQTALQGANLALQAGRDRLEARVAERTAELTDANDEIQRFAYIVSHDLRAPLLNIIGFTSELSDATLRLNRFVNEHLEPAGITVPADVREASQEDLPEAIRFIQTSTAKMDRLITAILRLSREGRRVLAPESLEMAEVLGSVADSVRQLADAAGAEIVLLDLPPLVSDRLAVEQVFSNLVENALKYLQPGRPGRITVSGRREGTWMRYDVADNGRGVAVRDLDRIFELFRRAGPQDTVGEGIGLAHVRALLRRLGGSIVCESAPGVGSTFVVRLPPLLPNAGQADAGEVLE